MVTILNTTKNMIIGNGKFITSNVVSCNYNNQIQKYYVRFKSGATYSYNLNNLVWMKNPHVLNPALINIKHGEKELYDIRAIYVFNDGYRKYLHICFENGTERDYPESSLDISMSCLEDNISRSVFEYLKQIADTISLKDTDGTKLKLLAGQYENIKFVGVDKVLSAYLNPNTYVPCQSNVSTPIFPFGCNGSQFRAVKAALENKISVIQGPPGTGKTQTILNIIANLVVMGKTVLVVSNNNSATANVLEKLSKYNLEFIVASLGNSENKKKFIDSQTGLYPNMSSWYDVFADSPEFIENINAFSVKLNKIYKKQEQLALARHELQNLEIELKHFEQYTKETDGFNTDIEMRRRLKSDCFMQLWHECQRFADSNKKPSFWFKIKSWLLYGISNWKFYNNNAVKIVNVMQGLFYQVKHNELTQEITILENELLECKASEVSEQFSQMSMKYLKNILFHKYGSKCARIKFKESDLWHEYKKVQMEYPVVLSTTFSARNSLGIGKDGGYDYVIMDEASQVDVVTGALALSCARNAVIVGDVNQLPNVITEDDQKRCDAIFSSFCISNCYNFAHKSFLQSICEVIPNAPQTLLKEHYRCHPKIINFCNQKFYGGELVIMSKDNGESNVLSAIKTVSGSHKRDHMNQRQIDVVKNEVLPMMPFLKEEIGIIAPYNDQVNAMSKEIDSSVEVATVHKFQGREKDAIILTTVDDEITDFTDDPNLLNVAVSRAKEYLCLVTSGNEQQENSNIGDLLAYIEYNNFSVTDSKLYSVFDYLYSQYTESRFEYLKNHKRVSEYDSENLMYALIENILKEPEFISLSVICHQPLKMLIRDPSLLADEECRYAMNSATHVDFLIYNRISKKSVLAIEVDGYHYHKDGTDQARRDLMKNHIFELYEIPYLRLATNGSEEREKIISKLREIISN